MTRLLSGNSEQSCGSLRSSVLFRVIQVFFCILIFDNARAFATDFSLGPNVDLGYRKKIVFMKGAIRAGDADRLRAFLRQRVPLLDTSASDYWGNVAISLDSPGGDFAEGLKIANFISDAGIGTLVQDGNTCASACALAFLGGSEIGEHGYTGVDRRLEVGGRLQFHAPYVDTGTVTTDRAELIRQLTNVNIELLKSMTSRFKVPPDIVDTLLRNDPEHSLYTVATIQMVRALKIRIEKLYRPRSITLEMATNLCVNTQMGSEGIPDPMKLEFEESRDLQGKRKILRVPDDGYTDKAAIPIAVASDFPDAGYCLIERSKDHESLGCSYILDNEGEIKTAEDLTRINGESCEDDANPVELLFVPIETDVADYKNLVQHMEARGRSIFGNSLPAGSQDKTAVSSGKSNSRGFICNDQAEYANMREGPHSKNFAVIAELANNTGVKVIDETFNSETGHPWLKISANGQEGFVDKDLVSIEKCAGAAAEAVEPLSEFKPGRAVICNSDVSFANMRSGPSPQNDLVMALDNGTPIKKLAAAVNEETQHPWLKIQAKGRIGYVDSEKAAASCETASPTVQPAADFKPGKAVICNSETSFANMRSGPGPQNDIVMALDNQTPIKKLGAAVNEETQHPWLKIQAKGKTGYVDADKVAASCDMDP